MSKQSEEVLRRFVNAVRGVHIEVDGFARPTADIDPCDIGEIYIDACYALDMDPVLMVEEYDDPMDGDHASALASAGFGMDEDYHADSV